MSARRFTGEPKMTPWWWEAAPPRPPDGGRLPGQADVAVIGAGYTGLCAALTLARAGRDVVVIDAAAPGHGASTRNGGQCGPGSQRFTARELIARYGRDKARALVTEGLNMRRHLGELIESEGIECHFRRVGRFRGAVIPAHYDLLARDAEDMHALGGAEFACVPRAEQHREVGSDFYQGGVVLHGDGALHPALYHRGLLERVEAAGARVIGHTPVTAVIPEKRRIRVQAGNEALEARSVLVATNGYTGSALPGFRARVVPIGSAIIATEPLDPAVALRLMPRGRVVGSSARIYHYMRLCPEGRRFLWGGRIRGWSLPDRPAGFAHLYRDMVTVFPELEAVPITHCWSGWVGYTRDVYPHLGQQGDLYFAMGYCGSGVVRASFFGDRIARRILGDPAGATAFDDLEFGAFPGRPLARAVVPVVTEWRRLRDALDRRRPGTPGA